ncbi:MAG: co-chaperone YbbN, partial [Propionibacteriaceae bacterium]|nr:co-chaperone YbbN [Propionibacteriaceae bacterium]
MSPADLHRPGVIDLSTLAPASPPQTDGQPGVSYVQDVTEAEFQSVAMHSRQYPVILELTLPSAAETKPVDQALIELANAAGGRWLLARVDVSVSPAIPQGLGIQAVPTVIALLGGQMVPLFQGTMDKPQISALIDKVLELALANGVTGKAQPVPGGVLADGAAATESEAPAVDPRFAKADEALAAGDYPTALAEFDKLLAANPRDAEAAAGKAQVGLLLRTADGSAQDAIATADAAPADIDANLAAADMQVVLGDLDGAFARLLRLIRTTSGD